MPTKRKTVKSKPAKKESRESEPMPLFRPERQEPSTEAYEDLDIEKGQVGETDETEETEDIYNGEQREEMLKDDEISAEENAIMEGNEMAMKEGEFRKRKKILTPDHTDTPSVELAKGESRRGNEPSDSNTY